MRWVGVVAFVMVAASLPQAGAVASPAHVLYGTGPLYGNLVGLGPGPPCVPGLQAYGPIVVTVTDGPVAALHLAFGDPRCVVERTCLGEGSLAEGWRATLCPELLIDRFELTPQGQGIFLLYAGAITDFSWWSIATTVQLVA